jgi:hypothetical protein
MQAHESTAIRSRYAYSAFATSRASRASFRGNRRWVMRPALSDGIMPTGQV